MEEPPAIRAVSSFQRDRTHDRSIKGSFAAIGKLHKQIEADFVYDPAIGRFTPKNAMGAAAETLDVLHQAKEDAEKSGLYKKMQSGNPDDLFDAAEAYGKVFAKLAEGCCPPRESCRPTRCWSSRPSRRYQKMRRHWPSRWRVRCRSGRPCSRGRFRA